MSLRARIIRLAAGRPDLLREARGGLRIHDLPGSEELLNGLQRISKVWSSEFDAEAALHRLLDHAGLEVSYRQASRYAQRGVEWQEWHLQTVEGDPVDEHLNVIHRPGPRPGWTSFQVSL